MKLWEASTLLIWVIIALNWKNNWVKQKSTAENSDKMPPDEGVASQNINLSGIATSTKERRLIYASWKWILQPIVERQVQDQQTYLIDAIETHLANARGRR